MEETLEVRLRRLVRQLDQLDDDKLENMKVLLTQMENLVLGQHLELEEGEQTDQYTARVKSMVRPRFGNYKKASPIKVHYRDLVDDKVEDLVAKGYYPCSGTCTEVEPEIECRNNIHFDPLESSLVILEFDHYLERNEIYTEMGRAIDNLETTPEFLRACPGFRDVPLGAYIKQNFRDPPKGAIQKAIYKLVDDQLDLDLYKDDLYGSNIIIRCKLCHNSCKSPNFHPPIEEDRYLRK